MRLTENSQCHLIFKALASAFEHRATNGGGWVAMPKLVEASGSYNVHSRIDELRHRHGVVIENDTDVSVRPHVSKYRLVLPEAVTEPKAALP